MMKMTHGKWIATTLVAGIWLTGCGGGGGGSSSSTPTATSVGYTGPTAGVSMTDQASADEVASATMAEAVNMDLADFTNVMKSGTTDTPTTDLAAVTMGMIDRSLSLATVDSTPSMLAGVETYTDTYYCYISGSMTFTEKVSDPYSYEPTPGDSYKLTANNCDDGSGYVMNGSFSMVLKSYTDSGNLTASVNFSNFTQTSIASTDYFLINGGFTMQASYNYATYAQGYKITGDALLIEQSDAGVTEQHALTQFSFNDTTDASWNLTADHDYTFYSTTIGGSVSVVTTTPVFVYAYDLYPSSGVVVITGDGDAKVRVTALDNTSVKFEYDLNADGIYGNGTDPAETTKLWTEL